MNPSKPPRLTPRLTLLRMHAAVVLILVLGCAQAIGGVPETRVLGLLLGSLIGDALGGPVEFQDSVKVQALTEPPKRWQDQDILDEGGRSAARQRLRLRSYSDLRPKPEPFAHWSELAPAGTVTDDTRHKMIFLKAVRRAVQEGTGLPSAVDLARAYLAWSDDVRVMSRPEWPALNTQWLHEWELASRWVLGERERSMALPPERIWSGLGTCCGQMTLPPLACLYPGQPVEAYQAAFEIGFFDNGQAKDLNPALIAGLAAALVAPPVDSVESRRTVWREILRTMRTTDPYRYGSIPWVTRPVVRWLDLAESAAEGADGRPSRMFARLDAEFRQTIKWEAQVPLVVAFACLILADFDPLVALQLSIEWGHDTDSYATLVGAFAGAVHGAEVFPKELADPVLERLRADYVQDLTEWVGVLSKARGQIRSRIE